MTGRETKYQRQEVPRPCTSSADRAKLDAARAIGLPILPYCGYPACLRCPKADDDTQRDAEDDICLVICTDPDCPEHRQDHP